MRITAKTDPALVHKEIADIKDRFLNNLGLDLMLSAKRLAFYVMEYTLPTSTKNPFMIANLQRRIWDDVHTVYPSVGDTNWQGKAYKVILDAGEEKKAKRFWQNHIMNDGFHVTISKKTGREHARIIKDDGKPRLSDEEAFSRIRANGIRKVDDKGYGALLKSKGVVRNKTWTLPANTRPVAIVLPSKSAALARKRQKKAGLAKSAWYQSVLKLGGIRNFTRASTPEGRFVWPKECVALSRGNSGIGSCTVNITESVQKITISNHLGYTDHACPPQLMAKAIDNAQNAMRIIFEQRAKAKQANGQRLAARRAA